MAQTSGRGIGLIILKNRYFEEGNSDYFTPLVFSGGSKKQKGTNMVSRAFNRSRAAII
jgi:hypothetical protein